ncbi:uncharacterized protein B0T23DRAFT_83939 [Neurospora hispaniola]|uniref:Uncharacterized protein n=1 Tax=Neurospora hispaniola TaxID=588809 RepID=A0AAJ0ICW7_9PEZI|nr:hypothetical protein B0T23DRAFT_83939 [Neurospora hispaniola]
MTIENGQSPGYARKLQYGLQYGRYGESRSANDTAPGVPLYTNLQCSADDTMLAGCSEIGSSSTRQSRLSSLPRPGLPVGRTLLASHLLVRRMFHVMGRRVSRASRIGAGSRNATSILPAARQAHGPTDTRRGYTYLVVAHDRPRLNLRQNGDSREAAAGGTVGKDSRFTVDGPLYAKENPKHRRHALQRCPLCNLVHSQLLVIQQPLDSESKEGHRGLCVSFCDSAGFDHS